MRRAFLLLLLVAGAARASELEVDRRTIAVDDTVTITLTVEGSFAAGDAPRLPLENLQIDGAPSVSSEFQWINGATSRKKIFRYVARPVSAGTASVGPLSLRGSDGQVETLAAITLQVLADAATGSNDPLRILRELVATNRDPIFLVVQADKTEVFENEEVVVTWTLYNGASVQQYGFGQVPKLDDFWTEELDVRNERPQDISLGGMTMERLVVRRVALFPLRSGTVTVPPMAVRASIMKRSGGGDPFGLFEGVVSEVHRRSAPLTIEAHAIPPGPPVVAVGVANLQCDPPLQRNGGPIAMDVSLTARANLRSAQAPRFASPVDGTSQVIDRGLTVNTYAYDRWMTRRWRYLIFPARAGAFSVPAVSAVFLTSAGERRTARCGAKTLDVSAAPEATPVRGPASSARHIGVPSPVAVGIGLLVAGLAFISIPRLRGRMRLRRQVRALLRSTPAETRAAVEAVVAARGADPFALLREASERGDAFRAFRSLIDAAEKDRIGATPREIGHRVRDVLLAIPAAVQSAHDPDAAADAAPIHGG